ncbi:MAG: ferric reductase-like transmembrane domain-containing protein [Candidatus Aenigmarchaeota archaeon]|nr:ferric reductase-like transmembrane domain-containing protein [Candidatus Aenigmarchaeota archaeon]
MQRVPHIISAFVVLMLSWYYFFSLGRPFGINYLNAIAAFSAVFIIGMSFLLGPIARFVPALREDLQYRKTFGLWGYVLASVHLALVPMVLLQNSREMTLADGASMAFAAVAFMIFTLMAITSTGKWIATLGYENWKSLQRTGYIAMAAMIFHVALLEGGVFFSRTTGIAAMAFILFVFLLRAIVLILGIRKVQKPNLQ